MPTLPLHYESPNTGDQLRGSIVCAGLVSCIPLFDRALHTASTALSQLRPALLILAQTSTGVRSVEAGKTPPDDSAPENQCAFL